MPRELRSKPSKVNLASPRSVGRKQGQGLSKACARIQTDTSDDGTASEKMEWERLTAEDESMELDLQGTAIASTRSSRPTKDFSEILRSIVSTTVSSSFASTQTLFSTLLAHTDTTVVPQDTMVATQEQSGSTLSPDSCLTPEIAELLAKLEFSMRDSSETMLLDTHNTVEESAPSLPYREEAVLVACLLKRTTAPPSRQLSISDLLVSPVVANLEQLGCIVLSPPIPPSDMEHP